MKLSSKSEWFTLDSPIGEPDVKWEYSYQYQIERVVTSSGDIIWFGLNTNWKKEKDGYWTVLTVNEKAKPLKKHLPDIVYGEDRLYFKPCEMPIYEKMYIGLSIDDWVCVSDLEPPKNEDVLVKSPDGKINLASWRSAYNIFTCQSKGESTIGWKWKKI